MEKVQGKTNPAMSIKLHRFDATHEV